VKSSSLPGPDLTSLSHCPSGADGEKKSLGQIKPVTEASGLSSSNVEVGCLQVDVDPARGSLPYRGLVFNFGV